MYVKIYLHNGVIRLRSYSAVLVRRRTCARDHG